MTAHTNDNRICGKYITKETSVQLLFVQGRQRACQYEHKRSQNRVWQWNNVPPPMQTVLDSFNHSSKRTFSILDSRFQWNLFLFAGIPSLMLINTCVAALIVSLRLMWHVPFQKKQKNSNSHCGQQNTENVFEHQLLHCFFLYDFRV